MGIGRGEAAGGTGTAGVGARGSRVSLVWAAGRGTDSLLITHYSLVVSLLLRSHLSFSSLSLPPF